MKNVKKAIVLVLCVAVLASIFTVPTFAANAAQKINIPTIQEFFGTLVSWRFRPLFWFINLIIKLLTGMPLFSTLV